MNSSGNPNIAFRKATIADAALLKYWDTKQHVIASGNDDDWNWEKELIRDPAWREQLIAELNGRPIGVVQIIDPKLEETHYWGNVESNLRAIDIWIGEEEDLGQGYGTTMMNLAIERCFKEPEVTSILIDPLETNVRAHKFYRKIGFKEVGLQTFDEDRCLVFRLDRSNWLFGNATSSS